MSRHGDNIRQIWSQAFKSTKSLPAIVDFFHRIFPYVSRMGGAKQLLRLFQEVHSTEHVNSVSREKRNKAKKYRTLY